MNANLKMGWFVLLAYVVLFCGCVPPTHTPSRPTYTVNMDGQVIAQDGTLIDYRFDIGDTVRHKCGIDVVVIDRRYREVWEHAYYKSQDEGNVSAKHILYEVVLFTHHYGLIDRWVLAIELEPIE